DLGCADRGDAAGQGPRGPVLGHQLHLQPRLSLALHSTVSLCSWPPTRHRPDPETGRCRVWLPGSSPGRHTPTTTPPGTRKESSVELILCAIIGAAIIVKAAGGAAVDWAATKTGNTPPSQDRWDKRQARRAARGEARENNPGYFRRRLRMAGEA